MSGAQAALAHAPFTYLDLGEVVSEANVEITIAVLPVENDDIGALLAAAPDLLNALRAAFHALKSYQYGNASQDLAETVAGYAAAAIAKAEGRA